MGGRGASSGKGGPSGGSGGGSSIGTLIQRVINGEVPPQQLAQEQQQGDYTNNGNPNLVKYQGQDDDKLANFLAKVDKTTDYNNYADNYAFYNNPLQKLVLQLGLNDKPTLLDDKAFNQYVQASGQQVVYRGVSGTNAADRLTDATYNHVGTGIYGDGHYFTPDKSTARSYANNASPTGKGVVLKMALSPNARVISYSALQAAMQNASPKLTKALNHAGGYGASGNTRSFGSNSGEAQYALKMGYNVVDMGSGYLYAITRDAFVVSKKRY